MKSRLRLLATLMTVVVLSGIVTLTLAQPASAHSSNCHTWARVMFESDDLDDIMFAAHAYYGNGCDV